MAKGGTGSESKHKPRWRQDLLAERELARRIHSVLRTRFDCNVCRESTQHSDQPDAHKERQVQPAEVECFACHGTCMSCSLPQPGTADAQTFGAYAHPIPLHTSVTFFRKSRYLPLLQADTRVDCCHSRLSLCQAHHGLLPPPTHLSTLSSSSILSCSPSPPAAALSASLSPSQSRARLGAHHGSQTLDLPEPKYALSIIRIRIDITLASASPYRTLSRTVHPATYPTHSSASAQRHPRWPPHNPPQATRSLFIPAMLVLQRHPPLRRCPQGPALHPR